jgi:hypothetical protein
MKLLRWGERGAEKPGATLRRSIFGWICTGTPPGMGLGRKPPVYLRAGQLVRLGIDGLGVQTQRIVAHA